MDGANGAVAVASSLPPSLPPAVVDRLVSIHAKLLQLVEAIAEFQRQLQYGGAEGMMGWQDILAKFSLLTSYTHSVFDLLVTSPALAKALEAHKATLGVEKPRYKTREEQRILAQQEQDAWKKALVQSVIHPGKNIEPDRDFIVQVLLRTKQIPEVEASEAELLATVPPLDDPAALYRSLKAHDELADKALAACKKLSAGDSGKSSSRWETRVTDNDSDNEDSGTKGMSSTSKRDNKIHKQPRYSTADIAKLMGSGQLSR